MILATNAAVVSLAPATQQDALALLLQDPEWVDAEFAAIMTASGFGDRVIVEMFRLPPRDRSKHTAREIGPWKCLDMFLRVATVARVRSPPGR